MPSSRARSADGEGTGQSAADLAYEQLRSRILDGDLEPGCTLAEGRLTAELGLSRTPIRQALHRLAQEDLVEPGARRQMVVRSIDDERRHEIFLVREALERLSLRQAALVATDNDLDELQLLLIKQQRAAKADARQDFLDLDEEFHVAIATAAHMPIAAKMVAQLRAFLKVMRIQTVWSVERMNEVVADHRRILEAVEAHDPDAAEAALAEHLQTINRLWDSKDPAKGAT